MTKQKDAASIGASSSFVLKQKKQKFKALHLRRSIFILNPKIKELASLKHLLFLRIFQWIDTRLPDANAKRKPAIAGFVISFPKK